MDYKIVKKNSPNKMSRKNWKPDMIVNHITEGAFAGSVNWLCNPNSGVSSHFVVSKKGEIYQLVDLKEASWANGTSVDSTAKSYYGISNIKSVRDRKTNANYYSVSIEHEGIYSQGYGALSEEQFKATLWLHKYIRSEVKKIYGIDIPIDRQHIIGHMDVHKGKPNCPGKNFPWERLLTELKLEEISMALEKWKEDMGKQALDSLNNKKDVTGKLVVDSPETWKKTLGEGTPQWLFWAIIDRIYK